MPRKAFLQNSRFRRIIIVVSDIIAGELVAIDLSNTHFEIIINLVIMLKVPNDKYQILNYHCENRIQDLYEIMVKFECEREAVKK